MKRLEQSNRTIYISDRYITLRSYNTYVAQIDKDKGTLTLSPFWHYSPTTWSHVRKFINGYKEELNETTQVWMHNMFNSKNGRAYMKMLIDNGIMPVESDWTLYDRTQDDK